MGDAELRGHPARLLRFDRNVSEADRALLTGVCELLWDDFFDCLAERNVADADLITLLPPSFQHRAGVDWRRWLVTFCTVTWKLGQPHPVPPASMAEQIVVALIADFADGLREEWIPDPQVDLSTRGTIRSFRDWLDDYLWDFDHDLLYEPELDGIDDISTDFQYGFGRMDYEGMFAIFNEANEDLHGGPHPLAGLRMTPVEVHDEQRTRELVERAAEDLADALVNGGSSVSLPGFAAQSGSRRIARDVGRLLELPVTPDEGGSVLRVEGAPDGGDLEPLQHWLNDRRED